MAKKIYMVLDMEGITGITNLEKQAHPGGAFYPEARELMTADVNAAVEGALEGGAAELVLYDMHCYGINLILEKLHPHAKLIAGKPRQFLSMDESFDGMFLIGFHARAGTPGGLLTHTYELGISKMFLNDILVGEIGMQAALAGTFHVPTIMISGDSKADFEAKELLGDIEFAVVKEAVGMESALCLAPVTARRIIKEKAQQAVRRSNEIEPFIVDGPVEIKIEFTTKEDCDRVAAATGITKINDNTVSMTGQTPLDAWHKYESSQAEVDLTTGI